MKEKNILKIKEVEALIAKSKAAGKFNITYLLSNDENLLDIGERKPIQIYLGTKEDFAEINLYLLEKQKNCNKDEYYHIEILRNVIWHFRQLQELQNLQKNEYNNLDRYGLYKVAMPVMSKNSKGEECDYESRTIMQEFFTSVEELIENKEELKMVLKKYIVYLPKKQQLIINEILNNVRQSEICIKYNMSKASVCNLYNKALKKLIELVKSNEKVY